MQTVELHLLSVQLLNCITQARFSKKKTRQDVLDDRSDQSLNVNTGIFEKSLTMEEEKSLAKTRRYYYS